MKWFGLTGGIASGKSTVSRMLAEEDVRIIDADVLAREVVEPGQPALQALVAAFGAGIVDAEGRLDRARLGQQVFDDADARKRLNAILHPAIAALSAQRLQEAREAGADFVVYDAALIVENGLHQMMDGLVVVTAPPELQQQRVVSRDGLTPEEARQRIASQLPIERKVAVATWVIDNGGTLEHTHEQVLDVLKDMRTQALDASRET